MRSFLEKPGLLRVNAAPRERKLSALLECAGRRGLTEALFDPRLSLGEIVLPTTHPNVAFVAAGILADPVEHVAAERAGALLDSFQRDHEIVLLCAGAVPGNALALAFAPFVGRVLLLATENETMTEELEAAQESLRIRNAHDIGLVLATRSRDLP